MSLSVKNFGGGGSIGSVENLFVPTGTTQTIGTITCTANGNGTYTVNGTNGTSAVNFNIGTASVTSGVKMVGCPLGGGSDTYRLRASDNTVEYVDNGVGVKIETSSTYNIYINIRPNAVCNNLVFKPMLTTNLKATYKEFVKRVGGFNNLLVPTGATQTINGVTITNNGDGTYTLNGTASANINYSVTGDFTLPSGTYRLNGCPNLGTNQVTLQMFDRTTSNHLNNQNGGISIKTYSSDITAFVRININSGVTFNNVTFKPMLTESLLPDYYDFVKGVEDIKTMLGCTKVAVSTYTPTSDTVISTSTGSPTMINHSLGQKPTFVAMISDIQLGATRYLISCVFHRNSNNNNNVACGDQICGNSVYGNINLYLIGSKLSTTQIALQTNTSNVYLKGGTTYKIIAMA